MSIINYLLPVVAHAQNITSPEDITQRLLPKIAGYFSTVFFILAGVYLILAALAYLQSGGEPAAIGKAKNRVIYAAVAIAVALLASSMKAIITSLLTV